MAMHPLHRTELLVGREGFANLQDARVCVIGLGGVGSYAAEALVRSGVGHVTMVDFDLVCVTNVNRQLHATRKVVGKPKVDLMAERAAAINPKAEIRALRTFYNAQNHDEILGEEPYDFVLDCIDNMTAKVHLLSTCVKKGQRVISAMGAGGRLDPTKVRVSDISETNMDPFARIVRDLLRQKGITEGVPCVWSQEAPNDLDPFAQAEFSCICSNRGENTVHQCEKRLQIQGSVAWMPSIFGLTMAGVVANELLGREVRSDLSSKIVRMKAAVGKPSKAKKKALMRAAGVLTSGDEATS
ncbi:MAG: tRNA threonylcarbamoyladenosine dehydratase [Proteobacteria bacterium]|nr:tRNA threonylcarbamoyladenosine dehydratase [Pseudomonadota bacterium]